ncbi:MAG: hypothetical protein HRT56_03555 [Coraliomargarita sp.]|nr:hypothetical protein [Coraliomargarita sp.]
MMNHRTFKRLQLSTLTVGTLALFAFTGCEKEQAVTYQIPKEARSDSSTQLPAGHPSTDVANASDSAAKPPMQVLPGMQEAADAAPDISFTLPERWTDLGSTGMRKANLRAGDAEVTALTFPGDVGGNLANINRWASQVGLPEMVDADLPKVAEPTDISNHGGLYVTLEGSEQSIRAGILPFHGSTWFFKMMGPNASIAEHEAGFKAFLESVTIADNHH